VRALLAAVRRRLRWTWAIATAQWAGPAVALGALGLVLAGWARPWGWPEPAAAGLGLAALAAVVAAAVAVRIPQRIAARSADRGLATRDAFAAALEVGDEPGLLEDRVRERAETLASGVTAADAVPVPWAGRRVLAAAVLGLGAISLAWIPNPQDDVRRTRAAEQAALDEQAEQLREAAAALDEAPGAGDAERALAEQLRELADELEESGSLDKGLEALAQARLDMQAQVPADLLAQKAAAHGLDRSLEAAPLPGATATAAADQLGQLAEALGGLTPEERAAVAARLGELATTQAVGNPAAAEALDAAAAALAAGDLAGAQAALGEAAAAQLDAAADVRAGDAAAGATGTIDAAAESLERGTSESDGDGTGDGDGQGGGTGQGTGTSPGEGSGQGNGPGQGNGSGQGSGSGSSAGQGSGSGSGAGQGSGGSPSGNVGAGGTRGGSGSGQGGQGQPSHGTGDSQPSSPDQAGGDVLVYDPEYTEGDQLDAGGTGDGRPGETVGKANGATGSGQTRVPLSRVLTDYQRRATEALARGNVPPSAEDVVRSYFDRIAGLGPSG
jgi:hypothetical protein